LARITNGEQIALVLQARLNRLKKQKKASRNEAKNNVDPPAPSERDALAEIAANQNLCEDGLARQVVGHLLEEEFGAEFALDHRFSLIVNKVSEMLQKDEASAKVLSATIEELKQTP